MRSTPYPPIEPRQIIARFPDLRPGEDVVAVSRSMTPSLVLQAYKLGIFPWPVRQGLVPWASPDPRAIFPLRPEQQWPRTVRRSFRPEFRVSFNEAFGQVMRTCAVREDEGTWITPDILATYDELHDLGWAHSVEVWEGSDLAGGLYGIAMGALFAGESMFHRKTGASKVAFASCAARLRERGFEIFDVQVLTDHLKSLGCVEVPRDDYRARVASAILKSARFD